MVGKGLLRGWIKCSTILLPLVYDRWLYWTDWGAPAKIERASMDGNSRTVLHDTGLIWPNGLTLDYESQRLYWVEANLNIIESSKVDGTGRAVLTTQFIVHPFDVTFYQGRLFWTDWAYRAILTVPTAAPENITLVVGLPTEPMGIHVITSSRQPEGNMFHCCTEYSHFNSGR